MERKIAILFEDKLYNQRGRFNAIRNRIRYLSDIADFSIDVFLITTYDPWYVRILRGTKKVERVTNIIGRHHLPCYLEKVLYHRLSA